MNIGARALTSHSLNVHAGHVTYAAVAKDLSLDYRSAETILGPLPYTTAA